MANKYIVVANGNSKQNGSPYSKLCRIVSGKDEETGRTYAYLSMKSAQYVDEILPVGKVVDLSVSVKA